MSANERRARAGAEAAEWWVRFESDDLSREQREQFVDWLRESPLHVAEMLRLTQVHEVLERRGDWRAHVGSLDATAPNVLSFPSPASSAGAPSAPAEPPRKRVGRWYIGAGLAACVTAVALLVFLFSRSQVIETGSAERRSVTLADGSALQIDPQSRLKIDLRRHERRVSLERGRVLFRVAKDFSRPFVVRVDGTLVRAVGTQFAVDRAREGIVVTVAEGRVSVVPRATSGTLSGAADFEKPRSAEQGAPGPRGSADAGHGPAVRGSQDAAAVLLDVDQQMTVRSEGSAEPVRSVDSSRELAWAAGRLVFDNESVADVVAAFNRYNVVRLHVEQGPLEQRRVSGVFDASEPESFIGFMQSVAPVTVNRAGMDITLSLSR